MTLIVLACVFGAALLGILLCPLLPAAHQGADSKDVIRLGMGLVATTVALVLGLLVASAKGFYDTQSTEVTQFAANVVLLDRVLAFYGTEATETRTALQTFLTHQSQLLEQLEGLDKAKSDSGFSEAGLIAQMIQKLSPKDDGQRALKSEAVTLMIQLSQTHWLMFEQNTVPIPGLLLVMLICWLIVLFISFGIFAPRNFTVLAGLCLSALAVCGAIFLILELYHPQSGLIRVSDAPLRAAIAQLGR
jgi:hypothetical protein